MMESEGSFLKSSVHCVMSSYARDLTVGCVVYASVFESEKYIPDH